MIVFPAPWIAGRVLAELLLDIDIIRERDERFQLLHPLVRVAEELPAFLCGTERDDGRERAVRPGCPDLLHGVAAVQVDPELDEVGALAFRHRGVGGIGECSNDLHVLHSWPSLHKKMRQ